MSCTIVTAFFRSPSKHSSDKYDTWMTNFLTTVNNEMVIFCDHTSFEFIKSLRKNFISKTILIQIEIEDLYCYKFVDYWKKDFERDTEKHIHNINLYIIWNEKPMFVRKAMNLNAFNSEFFMWCDIGCFRNKEELELFEYEFPSKAFMETAKRDRMYFLNIEPFNSGDFDISTDFQHVNRICAALCIGHHDIYEEYVDIYYKYLNMYMNKNNFAGKDQNIIASMYVCHPEMFELVQPVIGEGNPWFYLQRLCLKAV